MTSAAITSRLKRYPEALFYLRKGVEILPGYDFGHNNLGVALEKTGRPAEAEVQYREAIKLNPYKPDAYLNLGEIKRHAEISPRPRRYFARDSGLIRIPTS